MSEVRIDQLTGLRTFVEGDGPAEADAGGSAEPLRDPLRASTRGGEPDLFSRTTSSSTAEEIDPPRPVGSLSELDEVELDGALAAWRERMRSHADANCLQLVVDESGAQARAQLHVLDFVPVAIARERERFTAYTERTSGGELLADIAAEEVRRRERLVAVTDDAIVICPWGSHRAYEVRVIPRVASPRFEDDDAGAAGLATALRALGARFGDGLRIDLWIRTAPRGAEAFHWHIDLAPKLAPAGAFAQATGVDIGVTPPEQAAAELREALG